MSSDAAREDYGVEIDESTWQVDTDRTNGLREKIRSLRNWTKAPFVSWDDEGTEHALAATE